MKKQLLSFFLVATCLLGAASPAWAGISYKLEDFEEEGLNSQISFLNLDGRGFVKAALSPDFQLGPLGLGLDFNLYIPTDGGGIPNDLHSVALRSISYDHNDDAGIKWGRLTDVTYGYGLIMDDYDSGSFGSTEFNTEKAGFKGYVQVEPFRVDAFYTASEVLGTRLSYTYPDSFLLGSPVVFGVTYVQDGNGINRNYMNQTVTAPRHRMVGADIGVPIAGDFFTLYTEVAKNLDNGEGSAGSAGFRGDFFGQLEYRLEYRELGHRFVPGYFNEVYEAVGYDFSQTESNIKGILGSLGASVFGDYVKAGFMYESYEGKDPLITAALGWRRLMNTVGVINYVMPFAGSQNAKLFADILYYTNGPLDYIIRYKRIYKSNSIYNESYEVGVRVNLNNLVPKLPFIM